MATACLLAPTSAAAAATPFVVTMEPDEVQVVGDLQDPSALGWKCSDAADFGDAGSSSSSSSSDNEEDDIDSDREQHHRRRKEPERAPTTHPKSSHSSARRTHHHRDSAPIAAPRAAESTESFLLRYCAAGSLAPTPLPREIDDIRRTYNGVVRLVSARHKKDPDTYVVRYVNNFLKSILFAQFVPPGASICDLACGRGQDMYKLQYSKPKFVAFVDISEMCLYEAEKRWKRNKYPFPATFLQADFCEQDFLREVDVRVHMQDPHRRHGQPRTSVAGPKVRVGSPTAPVFDVVSCQFSAQYAFYSLESARRFVVNVARLLKPGGIFLGTAPQGEKVFERLLATPPVSPAMLDSPATPGAERSDRDEPDGEEEDASWTPSRHQRRPKRHSTRRTGAATTSSSSSSSSASSSKSTSSTTSSTTSVYSDRETERFRLTPDPSAAVSASGERRSGVPYRFTMKNTLDCREYTMMFEDLLRLCTDNGLRLMLFQNMRTLFESEVSKQKHLPLMERMGIRAHTTLSATDAENVAMYACWAFVKPKVRAGAAVATKSGKIASSTSK